MRDNRLGAVIDTSFTIKTNGVIHLKTFKIEQTKLPHRETDFA